MAFALPALANAQAALALRFSDPQLTDGRPIHLEAYEYRPQQWNGHVILMSHGSTGGNETAVKSTVKYLNISRHALSHGYAFVTWMRKGRGASEGRFTEESGRCDYASLTRELREAESQLQQVSEQVRARFQVQQLILMGHSRGGFLSASYAAQHPDEVLAVVNLAGAWSAACESRNGGFGRTRLEDSAKRFKAQFWAYFEKDSYFATGKFGDWDYRWMAATAAANGLTFRQFGAQDMPDGHATPTFRPNEWAQIFFPELRKLHGKSP